MCHFPWCKATFHSYHHWFQAPKTRWHNRVGSRQERGLLGLAPVHHCWFPNPRPSHSSHTHEVLPLQGRPIQPSCHPHLVAVTPPLRSWTNSSSVATCLRSLFISESPGTHPLMAPPDNCCKRYWFFEVGPRQMSLPACLGADLISSVPGSLGSGPFCGVCLTQGGILFS